jgi:hypothetical protein
MGTEEYDEVLKVLRSHKVSVVSVGITSNNDLKRTVFSFRVKDANLQRVRSVLRKKGYSVLPDN